MFPYPEIGSKILSKNVTRPKNDILDSVTAFFVSRQYKRNVAKIRN